VYTVPSGYECNAENTLCFRHSTTNANRKTAGWTCKAEEARVCTYQDMQELCASGLTPYMAANAGWYGDHGTVTSSGNWDNEYGVWNSNSCGSNNDGAAQHSGSSMAYTCCKSGDKPAADAVTCPTGLTQGTTNGEICYSSNLQAATDAHTARVACGTDAMGNSHVCTYADTFQMCGAGINPYSGSNNGWYGDHGLYTAQSNYNWDDEYGTWNRASCTENNDGPAYHYDNNFAYRCCGAASQIGSSVKVCPSGFTKSGTVCWMIPDGNPSSTATEAMDYCKGQRSHMCTHSEMIEACDNGSGNTIYGDSSGWYGDHGVASTSGTWDNYFGTWNSASCPTSGNNDGPPYIRSSTFKFRCCARAYPAY